MDDLIRISLFGSIQSDHEPPELPFLVPRPTRLRGANPSWDENDAGAQSHNQAISFFAFQILKRWKGSLFNFQISRT